MWRLQPDSDYLSKFHERLDGIIVIASVFTVVFQNEILKTKNEKDPFILIWSDASYYSYVVLGLRAMLEIDIWTSAVFNAKQTWFWNGVT